MRLDHDEPQSTFPLLTFGGEWYKDAIPQINSSIFSCKSIFMFNNLFNIVNVISMIAKSVFEVCENTVEMICWSLPSISSFVRGY